MKTTVICYDKCSTCKKALKWLDDKKIEYDKRPIKEKNPTEEEIKQWYNKSGMPLKRFFNTSGVIYKDMRLKDKLSDMSEDEQIKLLSSDGMIVKRPIVVNDNFILVGFKEQEWQKAFNDII